MALESRYLVKSVTRKESTMKYKICHDTMGEVKVPADRYWGSQTQRSFENFKIGKDRMPSEVIYAFAQVKKAAAHANQELGVLDEEKCKLICQVCEEILSGKLDDEFPLVVYQTGSGTQSNMNVNEVIANRGNEIAGREILHPNDHVNKSQSSNDTFPTAMYMAGVLTIQKRLLPAIHQMTEVLKKLEDEYKDIVKTGRTHLQDATPLTLGQEISGWRSMLEHSRSYIEEGTKHLREIPLGGTAVGTGLNAPKGFDQLVARYISEEVGEEFRTNTNKFHGLSSKDGLVFVHGSLKALATDLMKMANDVRLLASGPRCGIGELIIPANEPGSSIMPGKVNPTQCEAVTMVAARVMGNDTTIGIGNSQGNFQLNVYMPVMAYAFLESVNLLADALNNLRKNAIEGIKPNLDVIDDNLNKSLMLVTALNPHIGYENSAKIAKLACNEGITLREACLKLGLASGEDFDAWVNPRNMI